MMPCNAVKSVNGPLCTASYLMVYDILAKSVRALAKFILTKFILTTGALLRFGKDWLTQYWDNETGILSPGAGGPVSQ